MTGRSAQKMKLITYQVKELYQKRLQEGYKNDFFFAIKCTIFSKTMLLNTKVFCE